MTSDRASDRADVLGVWTMARLLPDGAWHSMYRSPNGRLWQSLCGRPEVVVPYGDDKTSLGRKPVEFATPEQAHAVRVDELRGCGRCFPTSQ